MYVCVIFKSEEAYLNYTIIDPSPNCTVTYILYCAIIILCYIWYDICVKMF